MFAALAVLAGALIAIQAGINSQLGVMLKSSLFATVVAFFVSAAISLLGALSLSKHVPALDLIKGVPSYLWFGGVLSALGVGLFYYLIPKMGVGAMMSLALTGQLIMAVVVSHFGWFGLPPSPATPVKVMGVLAMVVGITLVNR